MRTFRHILISSLAAFLAALAAWIVTVNLYATWRAFAHAAVGRAAAFRAGFLAAGCAAVAVFLLVLYLRLRKGCPHRRAR